MRIVFLNPIGVLGGGERNLLDLLASVRSVRPDFELILLAGSDGPLLERARTLGVAAEAAPMPVSLLQMGESGIASNGARSQKGGAVSLVARFLRSGRDAWRYVIDLRRRLEELRPDVIHTNGIKYHLLARLAAPRGVPIVWHVQDYLGQRSFSRRALPWAAGRASAAIAISSSVGDDIRALLPRLPVHVIYAAIDTNYFAPTPDRSCDADSSPSLTDGEIRIGLIAAFARWKGHDIFLQAAARAIRRRPDLPMVFYVIGGAIYQTTGSQFSEPELLQMAVDLGIADRVRFIGFQEDVAAMYRSLDVVAHCSTLPEPFGRTIVEAMACGRATIVSRAGGAAELFEEGRDALGTAPGDADALAEAISRLASSSEERTRMGSIARRSAVERFSRQRLGVQIAQVYASLRRQNHATEFPDGGRSSFAVMQYLPRPSGPCRSLPR